jgi:uncharacterized protein
VILVSFTFGNFRSFRAPATLSLVAASKLHTDPELDAANVFRGRERPRLDLLRVAALYGANASGKSNVGLALDTFREAVRTSANLDFRFGFHPFLLDTTSRNEPSTFEIIFIVDGVLFRYGLAVRAWAKQHEIIGEWLYQATSSVETLLFERSGDRVERGKQFREGAALLAEGRLRRKEALFLSLNAQMGSPLSSRLVEHLCHRMHAVSGLDDEEMWEFTLDWLKTGDGRERIARLLRIADTGISGFDAPDERGLERLFSQEADLPVSAEEPEEYRAWLVEHHRVLALHPVFDDAGSESAVQPFPLTLLESQGTNKLFAFAGPVLATLDEGNVLLVDELDARFHPLLTQSLVRLFQSPETNPENAQLIFITHDTNLLSAGRFRRDQIWFVEKDRFGASHLYSLADFKNVRKEEPFEANYIGGRYGAIPFLGGWDRLRETLGAETMERDPLPQQVGGAGDA